MGSPLQNMGQGGSSLATNKQLGINDVGPSQGYKIGNLAGGIGGSIASSAAAPAVAGAIWGATAPAWAVPVVGPLLGLGAMAVQKLITKFTQRGRDKKSATAIANHMSDFVWKDPEGLAAQYNKGAIDQKQFMEGLQQVKDWYKSTIGTAMKGDKTIASRSMDQLNWLDQGVNSFFGSGSNTTDTKNPYMTQNTKFGQESKSSTSTPPTDTSQGMGTAGQSDPWGWLNEGGFDWSKFQNIFSQMGGSAQDASKPAAPPVNPDVSSGREARTQVDTRLSRANRGSSALEQMAIPDSGTSGMNAKSGTTGTSGNSGTTKKTPFEQAGAPSLY
jgi:hypothetical protein